MPTIGFPRHHLGLLQDLAARLLDSRKHGTESASLARDLLVGFFDVCMRWGLDGALVELQQAFPPLDLSNSAALAEHPVLLPALVERLDRDVDLDDGGPRNAKPRQLADCLVASLGLTLTDQVDKPVTLGDDVRAEVTAALTSVVDAELSVPQIRETIIAKGRELCDPRYANAFERIAAQLDDRGLTMLRQPKLPLDAVQAVQRVLFESRNALVERTARAALDRAKPVLARADAEAAARLELPITHKLTPRDVAILRACDARVPKAPAAIVLSLLESLTDGLHLVWRAPERPVRAYAASQTFGVGDLLEHPKFGRGSVVACAAQRIEVEFADGKHTLVQGK